MSKWALRILVPFLSVLIVMPWGWCCWLPTAPAEKAKEDTKSSCCSHAKQTKNVAPVKPTEEKPGPPACCCDPLPLAILGDVPDGTDGNPAVALAVVPEILSGTSLGTCAGWFPVPFLQGKSPPLHLLHCVWLC
jgi:hypothetical protein